MVGKLLQKKNKKMIHTQKIWKAGTGTLVITIPHIEKEQQNLQAGDYIKITIELAKKAKKKFKVKNIE